MSCGVGLSLGSDLACGVGCSSDLTPSLGTSICHGCKPKNIYIYIYMQIEDTGTIFIEKKSMCKWTHSVQAHIVKEPLYLYFLM